MSDDKWATAPAPENEVGCKRGRKEIMNFSFLCSAESPGGAGVAAGAAIDTGAGAVGTDVGREA